MKARMAICCLLIEFMVLSQSVSLSWGMFRLGQNSTVNEEKHSALEKADSDSKESAQKPLTQKEIEDLQKRFSKLNVTPPELLDASTIMPDSGQVGIGLIFHTDDGIKEFDYEMASFGMLWPEDEEVSASTPYLPDYEARFLNERDSTKAEYIFLFPDLSHMDTDDKQIWGQLLFKEEPRLVSISEINSNLKIDKVFVSQKKKVLWLVAFKVPFETRKINLVLEPAISGKALELLENISGLLVGEQVKYFQNVETCRNETPEKPMLFAYRQAGPDTMHTFAVVKDLACMSVRPGHEESLYDREPWLGISGSIRKRMAQRRYQREGIEAISKSAAEKSKEIKTKYSIVKKLMEAEESWSQVKDSSIEKLEKDFFDLSLSVDTYYHYLFESLFSFKQGLMSKRKDCDVKKKKDVWLVCKEKNEAVVRNITNLINYCMSINTIFFDLSSFLYDDKILERLKSVTRVDVFKLTLKVLMANYDMEYLLEKESTCLLDGNIILYRHRQLTFDRTCILLETLILFGDNIPLMNIMVNNSFSEDEMKSLERFGLRFVNDVFKRLEENLGKAGSNKKEQNEAVRKTGIILNKILWFGFYIRSTKVYESALKALSFTSFRQKAVGGVGFSRGELFDDSNEINYHFLQDEELKEKTKNTIIKLSAYLLTICRNIVDGSVSFSSCIDSHIAMFQNSCGIGDYFFDLSGGMCVYVCGQISKAIILIHDRQAVDFSVRGLQEEEKQLKRERYIEELFHDSSHEKVLAKTDKTMNFEVSCDETLESRDSTVVKIVMKDSNLLWMEKMAEARSFSTQGDYETADNAYLECEKMLDEGDFRKAYVLIERADLAIRPWQHMLYNLDSVIKKIFAFQRRINTIDIDKLKILFTIGGNLKSHEYRKILDSMPAQERVMVDVPDHIDRDRFFWRALNCVWEYLSVPQEILVTAKELYRRAVEILQVQQPAHEGLEHYKMILQWLIKLVEQREEAKAVAAVAKDIDNRLKALLKITGTYRLDSHKPVTSWKSVLVQVIGKEAEKIHVGETGIYSNLGKSGLADTFEWVLLPHQDLTHIAKNKRMKSVAKVLWQGGTLKHDEGEEEFQPYMLIPLGSKDILARVHQSRVRNDTVIITDSSERNRLIKESLNDSTRIVIACRSGTEEALCQELVQNKHMFFPVRVRRGLDSSKP
ncbi:hypothetical protein M3P05_16645 [Sansalvadorimonas sp. 2012CJ34-2]|uniref:Uncharacterized protein n=1 Tax=Parendozoicomonas callyspongiae TaxID=2942213 RepID=A0ABT0PJY0_9GAMM|nr:hypothetical protein [Sansalvadorimonas sp. 2012CJ34-2]MCL6271546.1 hypothetical protein [Sansalvadorimonas sp. 2012CJ34-2]